ncbi:MAG: hypothetical protein LBJ04_04775 [Sphingobacterium sp.]|nr:hypothetical protein [Sphingobacterium sp.]
MGLRLLLLVCVSAFFCSCHPDDKKMAPTNNRPNEVSFSGEDAETSDKSSSIRTFINGIKKNWNYNKMLSCLGSNSSQKLAVGSYATEARKGAAARFAEKLF